MMISLRLPALLSLCLGMMLLAAGCASSNTATANHAPQAHANSTRWSPSLDDQPTTAAPVFHLARDGKPAATIVIAADALDSNRQAAELLQTYVKKIAGATLPIVDDTAAVQGPVILIGQSKPADAMVAALNLQVPAGFSRKLNEEGYVIHTTPDRLLLVGNDYRPSPAYHGSLLAVVEVLNRLGCRWFYPGEIGESYPTSADVNLPAIRVTVKPDNAVRGFWYGTSSALRRNKELKAEVNHWYTLNRFLPYGSVLPSAGDGSIMAPFRKWETREIDGKKVRVNTFFEDHPEYFAFKKDGTRDEHYLCLSYPGTLDATVQYAREYFAKKPDSLAFPISPPDGAPTCECDECKAHNKQLLQKEPANPHIQDISDGFYWYMNQVAKRLEKEFPDKLVTSLAYSGRTRPPENLELHPNITIRTALLAHARHHRYDWDTWHTREMVQLFKRWADACDLMIDRPYFPVMQFHCNVYQPLLRTSAFNIRYITDLGFHGMEWESKLSFFMEGASNYLRAQLLWNTDTNVEALLEDYYVRAYGPTAGKKIAAFDKAVEKSLTENKIDHHEEERLHEIYPYDWAMKTTAAAGDLRKLAVNESEPVRQRVDLMAMVVEHFRHYAQMREAEKHLDFAAAARHAQGMIDVEAKVNDISLAYLDDFSRHLDTRPTYGLYGANATAHGKLKQYIAKDNLINGTTGTLVAALPVTWQFKTDPHDDGIIYQWYSPEQPNKGWRPMRTTESWEIQGLQDDLARGYDGHAWYRTTVNIPQQFEGKPMRLVIGAMNDQAWVWVNGKLAVATPAHEYWQRWLYHQDLDITPYLKPGQENHIAIRIYNDQDAGGIFRRCFIYSPNPKANEASQDDSQAAATSSQP